MRRAGVIALVAVVLLAACGGDDDEAGTTTTSTTTPPSTASTAPGDTPPSTSAAGPSLADVSVQLTPVVEAENPTAMAVRAGDDRLFVAEQEGRVLAVRDGEAETFVDFVSRVESGGEQGLLGIAFSPEGERLFVSYTNENGNSRVDEYRLAGDEVDVDTRREVLAVDQPFPNHNGGNIVFGPDGYLWFGLGDGGSGGDPQNNGQDTSTLLGDLLRIDPLTAEPYAIPPDNPFADGEGGQPEIWAFGLRNPWRFSFDRETDDLWIADVGQNRIEEINFLPASAGQGRGANLGWRVYEGSEPYQGVAIDGTVFPVFEYGRDGGCSITGGFVYRGSRIPALRGAYVFADYCAGDVRALVLQDGEVVDERELGVSAEAIQSFGEDAEGELYVLSADEGVLRLEP